LFSRFYCVIPVTFRDIREDKEGDFQHDKFDLEGQWHKPFSARMFEFPGMNCQSVSIEKQSICKGTPLDSWFQSAAVESSSLFQVGDLDGS
jgi:hypothetical protein